MLFEVIETFIYCVFNANLQTDIGKTIVRGHSTTTDAQAVWRELSEHHRILSKVQKSFWSCTHVNSCQNYTLYTNLHLLLNI